MHVYVGVVYVSNVGDRALYLLKALIISGKKQTIYRDDLELKFR